MANTIANEHKEINKAINNELFRLASHYKATTSKGMTKGDIMQAMNFTGQEPLQHKQDYLLELENMTEQKQKELYRRYWGIKPMKKIGTKLELIGIRGNINYSNATIKQFKSYLKDIDCQDIIDIHTKELEKWSKILNEYRQDITFIKSNKIINYKR